MFAGGIHDCGQDDIRGLMKLADIAQVAVLGLSGESGGSLLKANICVILCHEQMFGSARDW